MPRTTLLDIARVAKVSTMTVSRALRKQGKVSESTRQRILTIAEEFGYSPDPQLSRLMHHLRDNQKKVFTENLGLIWMDGDREAIKTNPFLKMLVNGLLNRAGELGFGIEEFWLADSDLSMKRLESILLARGISGLIIAPLLNDKYFNLLLNWEQFSVVFVGSAKGSPRFHCVKPDHFQSMTLAIKQLSELGYSRIGLCVTSLSPDRQDHRWEASFTLHHPLGIREASELILLGPELQHSEIRTWIDNVKPDAVLFQGIRNFHTWIPGFNADMDRQIGWATLDWIPELKPLGFAGINQHYAIWGAHAADAVSAQILCSDRGLPEHPKQILTEGTWVNGKSAPRRG